MFNDFWEEVTAFLEENSSAVDERRHSDVLHMPTVISVRHLRECITERLDKKFPNRSTAIPSAEWIRLQFWPSDPYANSALKYTGRFQVKYAVQVRQLRKDHPDSKYVNVLLQYVKEFAVQYKAIDDKATIPVGEPNLPVSTGVRGHNRSLVPTGLHMSALDHDFHVGGLVPSVAYMIDTPDCSRDSFFQGRPHVILKDKVTQPSSAMRHSGELKKILEKDGKLEKPVLLMVSDGGPDHNVTFGSVKLALIALFRALDLDMLISICTCPYQSWRNMAERVMATLNLALQNVSLEAIVWNKSTMKDLRKAITENPGLCSEYRDSMAQPTRIIADRFRAMKLKGEPVVVGFPATEAELTEMVDQVRFIEPNLSDDLSASAFDKAPTLQKFVESHCNLSHYVFQIRKCSDQTCYYCSQHPVRMDCEQFSALSYLPLPLLDERKENFVPFSQVYGKPPSGKDRPSKGQFEILMQSKLIMITSNSL